MAPNNMHPIGFYIFVLILGLVSCQLANDLDIDDIQKQIHSQLHGLDLNSTNLPSEADIEKVLKEKCDKNGGGEEAYNALKNQQSTLQLCLEAQLNFTQIQLELDEAKKTGSMDEIFGKYCQRYSEIHDCIENVTESVKPCLDAQEKETLVKALKIGDELKAFVCFKDGDRIAMFVAEGGVECLESNKDGIQKCANDTLGSRIPTDLTVNNLPTFLFSERDCNDFDKVRSCVNLELEKCKDSTPANIVDAFFKFLKKQMPCRSASVVVANSEQQTDNYSDKSIIASSLVLMSSLVCLQFL